MAKNKTKNIREEALSEIEKRDIRRALKDVKRGKVKPIEQVAREMNIILR